MKEQSVMTGIHFLVELGKQIRVVSTLKKLTARIIIANLSFIAADSPGGESLSRDTAVRSKHIGIFLSYSGNKYTLKCKYCWGTISADTVA